MKSTSFVVVACAIFAVAFALVGCGGGGGSDPLGLDDTMSVAFDVQTLASVDEWIGTKDCVIQVIVAPKTAPDTPIKIVYEAAAKLGARVALTTNIDSAKVITVNVTCLNNLGLPFTRSATLTYEEAESIMARLQRPVITVTY